MSDIQFLDEPPPEIQYIEVEGDVASPHGAPCRACGAPVDPGDHFCTACGTSLEEAPPPPASQQPQRQVVKCQNCGSEVARDPDQRSLVCPFCDSNYVVDLPEVGTRETPEFVIGFRITPDQAREKFRKWIRSNSFLRPGDLKLATLTDKQQGVYLPFWSFSMLARSRWRATIGEYWYRTETYTTTDANGKTVTKTRRVQETEWWPLAGKHHRYYSGYLVSGSKGLSQADAERIKPFSLPALKRYEPHYLAGWLSEEYSIEKITALKLSQQEFYRREQTNVAHFLPGDTHRQLEVSTQFDHVLSDLCLLPVYVLSYHYKGKLYRFLVNGQTGRVAGDKPWSGKRIGALIGFVVVLLAILIFLIAMLNR